MSGPNELVDAPGSDHRPMLAEGLIAPLEEDVSPGNLFQEINERRARIENAELLRRLRGL